MKLAAKNAPFLKVAGVAVSGSGSSSCNYWGFGGIACLLLLLLLPQLPHASLLIAVIRQRKGEKAARKERGNHGARFQHRASIFGLALCAPDYRCCAPSTATAAAAPPPLRPPVGPTTGPQAAVGREGSKTVGRRAVGRIHP